MEKKEKKPDKKKSALIGMFCLTPNNKTGTVLDIWGEYLIVEWALKPAYSQIIPLDKTSEFRFYTTVDELSFALYGSSDDALQAALEDAIL